MRITKFIKRNFYQLYLNLYKKEFSNYKEALKYCNSISKDAYNNEYLNEFKFKKFKSSIDQLPFKFNNSYKLLLETIMIYFYEFKKLPSIMMWVVNLQKINFI